MREIVEGDVMLTDAYGYTSPSLVRHSFPSHYIDSEANPDTSAVFIQANRLE